MPRWPRRGGIGTTGQNRAPRAGDRRPAKPVTQYQLEHEPDLGQAREGKNNSGQSSKGTQRIPTGRARLGSQHQGIPHGNLGRSSSNLHEIARCNDLEQIPLRTEGCYQHEHYQAPQADAKFCNCYIHLQASFLSHPSKLHPSFGHIPNPHHRHRYETASPFTIDRNLPSGGTSSCAFRLRRPSRLHTALTTGFYILGKTTGSCAPHCIPYGD
jgi:hypothetical protein